MYMIPMRFYLNQLKTGLVLLIKHMLWVLCRC